MDIVVAGYYDKLYNQNMSKRLYRQSNIQIEKQCLVCGINIYVYPYEIRNGHDKYCTLTCNGIPRKGIRFSKDTEFVKGESPYNKGTGYTPAQKKIAKSKAIKKYNAKDPQKQHARSLANNAIRDGKLIRQKCESCDIIGQAHHENYMKPLLVRWLCPKHHKEVHKYVTNH